MVILEPLNDATNALKETTEVKRRQPGNYDVYRSKDAAQAAGIEQPKVIDAPRKKRKTIQGPNPLSCKKKKLNFEEQKQLEAEEESKKAKRREKQKEKRAKLKEQE